MRSELLEDASELEGGGIGGIVRVGDWILRSRAEHWGNSQGEGLDPSLARAYGRGSLRTSSTSTCPFELIPVNFKLTISLISTGSYFAVTRM